MDETEKHVARIAKVIRQSTCDIRGERIDESKIWSSCPNCAALRARIDLEQTRYDGISSANEELRREKAALLSRLDDVEGITNVVEYQRGIEEDSSEDIARAVARWVKEGL